MKLIPTPETTGAKTEGELAIAILADVTISCSVAECVIPPLVAFTVTVYVPVATVPATWIVNVDELVLAAEVSISLGPLKDADTPSGAVKVNEIGEAKLFSEATYKFTVPDAPCAMDMPEVEKAREKSP